MEDAYRQSADLWRRRSVRSVWFAAYAALLLASLFVSLIGYDFGLPYHLHPDEPFYAYCGGLVRLYGLARVDERCAYPPGYLLLQSRLQRFGPLELGPWQHSASHFALSRLVNLLLHVATAAVAGAIALEIFPSPASLLAVAFVGLNPAAIEYARNAKPDSPYTFLTILAVALALIARRKREPGLFVLSTCAGLGAVAMKYQALPVLAVPLGLTLLTPADARARRDMMAAQLSLTLVTLGWLWFAYRAYDIVHIPAEYVTGIWDKEASLLAPVSLVPYARAMHDDLGKALFVVPAVVGGTLALAFRGLRRMTGGWAITVAVGTGSAILYEMSLFGAVARHQVAPLVPLGGALWAAGFAAVASAVGRGMRRWTASSERQLAGALQWAAIALGLALLVRPARQAVAAGKFLQQPDTRALTADWFAQFAPSGPIVAEYDAVEFMRDYGGYSAEKEFPLRIVPSLLDLDIPSLRTDGVMLAIADERSYGRGGYFSNPSDSHFLSQVTVVKTFSNRNYTRPGPNRTIFWLEPIEHALQKQFGDSIQLVGYGMEPAQVVRGQSVTVTLYWRGAPQSGVSYSVFTHLLDRQGQRLAGQHDSAPANGTRLTVTWTDPDEVIVDAHILVVDPESEPGEYLLQVGLYNPSTGERLPVLDADGNYIDTRVVLQAVTVK